MILPGKSTGVGVEVGALELVEEDVDLVVEVVFLVLVHGPGTMYIPRAISRFGGTLGIIMSAPATLAMSLIFKSKISA